MIDKNMNPSCPICGKTMRWIKDTLLCIECDSRIIWDIMTPQTTKEEQQWVDRNSGGVGRYSTKKES